jgi:pheromone mating factor STE2 GPCR
MLDIFAALQFVKVFQFPEMITWYFSLTVLSLPLSSLWASTAADGTYSMAPAASGCSGRRPMLGGGTYNSMSYAGGGSGGNKSILSEKSVGGRNGMRGEGTRSPLSLKWREQDLEIGELPTYGK